MGRGFFKKQGKEKIKQYVKKGVLNASQMMRILDAENYSDIIKAISLFLEIDEDKSGLLWSHVINKVWMGVLTNEDRCTVFNEHENIFFREMLRNGGMLTRKHCIKNLFRTPRKSDNTATNLEEMGIIDSIKLKNEVVYILNFDFYKEVFG